MLIIINYQSPYLLVAAGGFIGAILRYLVDIRIGTLDGTLIANVIGCFCFGALMSGVTYFGMMNREERLFFLSGILGSFTTFSTLMVQAFQLGAPVGLGYLSANMILGFIALYLGRLCILRRMAP